MTLTMQTITNIKIIRARIGIRIRTSHSVVLLSGNESVQMIKNALKITWECFKIPSAGFLEKYVSSKTGNRPVQGIGNQALFFVIPLFFLASVHRLSYLLILHTSSL